jgi:hypothetical protein
MSAQCEVTAKRAAAAPMSPFERWLTLWVALCIVAGVALGQFFPAPFQALGRMEVAQVNLPVGLLIWVMIIPMLMKIDFAALHQVKEHWRGIGVTLFVNWAVKPFSMALLAWLFIRQWFAVRVVERQVDGAHRLGEHRTGLLGVVADGDHQVDRLVHEYVDVLRVQAVGDQIQGLQGSDGTVSDLGLRFGAGGDGAGATGQVVVDQNFGHLRAAGVASAEDQYGG